MSTITSQSGLILVMPLRVYAPNPTLNCTVFLSQCSTVTECVQCDGNIGVFSSYLYQLHQHHHTPYPSIIEILNLLTSFVQSFTPRVVLPYESLEPVQTPGWHAWHAKVK